MPDLQPILQLGEELKGWIDVVKPLVVFGLGPAKAIAKWFSERYKHDTDETREQAIRNGADAARRIHREIEDRVKRGELTEQQAQIEFQRPDIIKHVQDSLIAASETPDEQLHEELAKLIGARLVAPRDSALSIFLRIACDRLKYLNARQLRLLGLTFAVLQIEPDRQDLASVGLDKAYATYLAELRDTGAPFRDLAFPTSVEFIHFEELGLAKLSSWSAWMGIHTSSDVSQSPLLPAVSARFLRQGSRKHGFTGTA